MAAVARIRLRTLANSVPEQVAWKKGWEVISVLRRERPRTRRRFANVQSRSQRKAKTQSNVPQQFRHSRIYRLLHKMSEPVARVDAHRPSPPCSRCAQLRRCYRVLRIKSDFAITIDLVGQSGRHPHPPTPRRRPDHKSLQAEATTCRTPTA
jgi:hypothetical protein